jgi:uncharacterized membrane protein
MNIQLIQFIALILLMLVTGVFWGPWFALHRSLHVFTKDEFIKIVKTLASNLAIPMRILMPLCIAFLTLSVWFYPAKESSGFYLSIAALSLTIISLLVTVIIEVPIVTQITQWTPATAPENWETLRDRWVKFHVIRTLAALMSFVCFIASSFKYSF